MNTQLPLTGGERAYLESFSDEQAAERLNQLLPTVRELLENYHSSLLAAASAEEPGEVKATAGTMKALLADAGITPAMHPAVDENKRIALTSAAPVMVSLELHAAKAFRSLRDIVRTGTLDVSLFNAMDGLQRDVDHAELYLTPRPARERTAMRPQGLPAQQGPRPGGNEFDLISAALRESGAAGKFTVSRVNSDGLAAWSSADAVEGVFAVVVHEDILAGDPEWKTRAEQAVSNRFGQPARFAGAHPVGGAIPQVRFYVAVAVPDNTPAGLPAPGDSGRRSQAPSVAAPGLPALPATVPPTPARGGTRRKTESPPVPGPARRP